MTNFVQENFASLEDAFEYASELPDNIESWISVQGYYTRAGGDSDKDGANYGWLSISSQAYSDYYDYEYFTELVDEQSRLFLRADAWSVWLRDA